MQKIPVKWFERDALLVARELLGKVISYNGVSGMIVETEAYKKDPASHGYKLTPRSEIMLRTHGHVYVYFVYGMYYCLNFTTNKDEVGAVLVRAVEPIDGVPVMKRRRKTNSIEKLTNGPGRLCQAFGITKKINGSTVNQELFVFDYRTIPDREIGQSKRIGISRGKGLPWRFYVKDSSFVSR